MKMNTTQIQIQIKIVSPLSASFLKETHAVMAQRVMNANMLTQKSAKNSYSMAQGNLKDAQKDPSANTCILKCVWVLFEEGSA